MGAHPNVETTRQGYDAFSAGDLEAIRDRFSPDIVWHVGGTSPFSGDYEGIDEVFGFFGKITQESGGTFKFDVQDILANDERVVVLAHVTAERNGKRLDQNTCNVHHVNAEGETTEFWSFPEDQAAGDAFWS